MKRLIFILSAFLLLTCSSSTDGDGGCEVVINANGPAFLKVVNRMGSTAEVFLPEYALGAVLRPHTCEIYGMAVGLRRAEISICADSDCDELTITKNIQFQLEDGETYTVELTQSFFYD